MEKERVRIVDIAEALGLSTATVSNVIHGKTKKISVETVKRVQQMLEEKKYIPSMAGLLLAQNDSKIIGVIVNDHSKYEHRVLQDPFISDAIDHLSEVIDKMQYFMMIKRTNNIQDIVRFASMWNMEGMVLIGFCDEDYDELRNKMHIPFVVYDGYFSNIDRFANISVDNIDGGYQVGKYLIQMGHRKVMYLADNMECTDEERFIGLKKALGEVGIGGCEENFFLIPFSKAERMDYYKAHLAAFKEFTAAFVASDVYAIELMDFLMDEGIHIPEQISIVGFDDIPACQFIRPKLTTIRQDGAVRAKLAMEMLMAQKRGEPFKKSQTIQGELIIRESVKKLP